MRTIIIAEGRHAAEIRQLCEEYLRWANARVVEEFGVIFDTDEIIESTMQHLDAFMPPCGRTLLGYVDDCLAGMACLKELTPQIGEIKRMYVRPAQRKQGLGRALIERLLDESGSTAPGSCTRRMLFIARPAFARSTSMKAVKSRQSFESIGSLWRRTCSPRLSHE